MRTFVSISILLLFPAFVFAAPTAPAHLVWATPTGGNKGSEVELSAFIYNSSEKTVTVSVLFADETVDIETTTLTIAPQTAKVAVVAWQVPPAQTTVTASVTSAVDATKKIMPELLGVIGTTTVGGSSQFSAAGVGQTFTSWFGIAAQTIDPWRLRQAKYFSQLRDQKREELGLNAVKDDTNAINMIQDTPGANTAPSITDYIPPKQTKLQIGAYATLLYTSTLAALFSSSTIFYISLILLALFAVRFFFGFFR